MDGGLNGLVVFSCSALAYHSLYQLMKGFLVRRIFDPILKWQAGQKLKLSDGEVAHIANLYILLRCSPSHQVRHSYVPVPSLLPGSRPW